MNIQKSWDEKQDSFHSLESYFRPDNILPGDFILFQMYDADHYYDENKNLKFTVNKTYKPIFAVIVEPFFYDMACAIHYVKYQPYNNPMFDKELNDYIYKTPKVEMVYDWGSYPGIFVIGLWKRRPSFKEVFDAYKNRIDFNSKDLFITTKVVEGLR